MPINGLMVTLSADPAAADEACGELWRRDGVECGERNGRWLPVVTEVVDQRMAKDLHAWMEALPGVEQVGVILCSTDQDYDHG